MVRSVRVGKSNFALVDDEDFGLVSQFRWHLFQSKHTKYAIAEARRDGKRWRPYMHGMLLGLVRGEFGDHEDGDGLNNCRHNIRKATPAQNTYNRRKFTVTAENPYKGVYRRRELWGAMVQGEWLGLFPSAEDAARAYDTEALVKYGEFARLNFPVVS